MILGIHDISANLEGNVDFSDYEVQGMQSSLYIDRVRPGESYKAQIGLLIADGDFIRLADSNTALMPADVTFSSGRIKKNVPGHYSLKSQNTAKTSGARNMDVPPLSSSLYHLTCADEDAGYKEYPTSSLNIRWEEGG